MGSGAPRPISLSAYHLIVFASGRAR